MSQQVDQILDLRWKVLRRKEWCLSILIVMLVVLEVYFRATPLLLSLVALLLVIVMLPAIWVYWLQDRRHRGVILWIRRFKQGKQSREMLRLWEASVAPWGQVVTLADRDARRPVTQASVALAAGTLVWALGHFLNLAQSGGRKPFDLASAIFEGLVVSGILFGPLLLFRMKFSSRSYIRSQRDMVKVSTLIERVRKGRGRPSKFIHCLSSDPETWKLVVKELSPYVSVVLLDYGNGMSANVEWEVRTLLEYCRPQKIVIALPPESPTDVAPDALQAILMSPTPSQGQPHLIACPPHVPFKPFNRRHEALVRPMQRIIGIATLS